MSTVLVTGGAGYIGSHTVRMLVVKNHRVIVLDNLVYGHAEAIIDDEVELVKGDVGVETLLNSLFDKYKFDAVLHFAAYAYVGES
ncbi:MAG: NAD-dependent epimerase/dehydratase family protein, partial [Marinoscillum sp.]